MTKNYVVINMAGNGEVQGSFTSLNKMIKFMKSITGGNIGFSTSVDLEGRFLGIGYLKRQHEVTYLKDFTVDGEASLFKVLIAEQNPEPIEKIQVAQ